MTNITSQNFEAELIDASLVQPVLLDIWAEWCGPCKALGPVLEKLEVDYEGRFKLAKLDADAEPEIAGQLSQMFGVRSIPFCVMFKGGQPVDGFVGGLPDKEVRKFLDKHVPSAAEKTAADEAAQAEELLAEGDPDAAISKLAAAVAATPANDGARYEYVRALLDAGRVDEAKAALDAVAGNIVVDPRLTAARHWLAAVEAAPTLRPVDSLEAAIVADKRDFQARFELAQRRFAEKRFTEAMDSLLEILMRDKAWNDELARKTYVAVLEVMSKAPAAATKADAPAKGALEVSGRPVARPGDPVVDGYRRKLSMVLF